MVRVSVVQCACTGDGVQTEPPRDMERVARFKGRTLPFKAPPPPKPPTGCLAHVQPATLGPDEVCTGKAAECVGVVIVG